MQVQPTTGRSPNTVAAGGVAFDPLAAGSTAVTAALQGGNFVQLPTAIIAMVVNP